MRKTMQHLDDEHMRLYEWSGTSAGIPLPQRSKRSHPWHASYAVLAVLTSVLILNGCDGKSPATPAAEQVGQAAPEGSAPPQEGAAGAPDAAQQVAPTAGSTGPQDGTAGASEAVPQPPEGSAPSQGGATGAQAPAQ